jgi:magnesium transporter
LVGIITWDDVADILEEEATEDMYKLAGISGERVFGPLRVSLRNRLPWLSINLATTFLAAMVINLFESTVARVAVLAVFLPVVAGQGGIGGTQTLTLVVRSMVLREISGRRSEFRLLVRELYLGILHGLLMAVMVGVVAYFWKGSYMLGIVLALAMLGNMIIAGLTGAGIPLLLARLKIDPAVASAVIVTTFTDVAGFFLFLGFATILIRFLI